MHNQNEEQLMFKKKKPTFAEWTMQNGVSVNNNRSPKPLTRGEVAPKATERVTSRASSNSAKISNTYTTSNRDLQNIHRNRNNSTVMSSRPERKRSGEISTRFLDYARNDRNGAQNDPHSTVNETYSANPYGSPVKIVGDNVTKKDYDDFWNAFHEESTGEKLNWAANQMQAKPQKQTPPQTRNSRNMMQWAMQERENLTEPQSPGRKRHITDEEDRAFLEGFNQDREEESRWNRMLDTVERAARIYKGEEDDVSPYEKAVADVLRAGVRSGTLYEAKEAVEDITNNINAIKGYIGGEYSNAELLAEIMEWDKADAEKVIAVLTNNNRDKSAKERELNEIEVALRLGGEVVDKAVDVGKAALWGGRFSPTYAADKKIEDMLKAAHYSRNYFNEEAPKTIPEAKAMGWKKMDAKYCHLFGFPDSEKIFKYMPLTGGGEQIFDKTTSDNGVVVTDPKNEATYNWFNYSKNPKLHGVADVAPWALWGNSPDDTTTMLERIWLPGVYEAYEEK